jgi:histidine phosphotransfer protein HptB
MINWDRVSELRNEIGEDDFAEVVTKFLEETDEVIARLPDCKDPDSAERALHFLKGSALNLGFSDLAHLCQDGETRAAAGEAVLAMERVILCYHASRVAFDSGRDLLVSRAS